MNLLRSHWFDIGGILAVITMVYVYCSRQHLATVDMILWLHLCALFIHQLEEYRYPGYFPGMVNSVVYKSSLPDRYPLNSGTALIINVFIGWLFYFSAAVFAGRFIWLGIGTMLVSLGNLVAHTVLFNVKGKTWYNPGMCTALILFLPLICWFANALNAARLATIADWIAGILLGIVLNIIGIVKLISWMADPGTTYIFEQRQLRPQERRS